MKTQTQTAGQTIRFFRRLADVRQEDLALTIERSQSWLSRVESNEYIPNDEELAKIKDALKIPDGALEEC